MNFVDDNGEPNIPELKWKSGYAIFWTFVVVYLVVAITFVFCLVARQTAIDDTIAAIPSDCVIPSRGQLELRYLLPLPLWLR